MTKDSIFLNQLLPLLEITTYWTRHTYMGSYSVKDDLFSRLIHFFCYRSNLIQRLIARL